MNELELIKSQLNEINNKRVRIQTLVDQASKQCKEIESKYNISSLQELEVLVNDAEVAYQNQVQEAQNYINQTNQVLNSYQGIL